MTQYLFYETVQEVANKIEKLVGKEKAYDFLKAVNNYGLYGDKPEEESEVWMFGLDQIFYTIDLAKERRQEQIEKGSKGGRPTSYNKEEIRLLKTLGYSNAQIAEQLGCSESTVKRA